MYSFFDILQRPFFAAETESSTFSKSVGIYCGSADSTKYFYQWKVLVYNVFSINNPYSYGELSILVLFYIARDTLWSIIFLFSFFFSDWSFIYKHFPPFLNMCCIFHVSHNILRQSKDIINFLLRYQSKESFFVYYLSVIK